VALTKEEIELELRAAEGNAAPLPPSFRVTFNDVFEALSFGKCRRGHAEEALRHPSAIRAYETGEIKMILATHVIEPTKGRSFVLIVLAQETSQAVNPLAGFRLYVDPGSMAALSGDPTAAFAAFLDRYGDPYVSGGIRSKFSTLLIEPRRPDGMLELMSGERRSERGAANVLMKQTADHVELAWPFLLDGDAYLSDAEGG
jgi:hypothetical protein